MTEAVSPYPSDLKENCSRCARPVPPDSLECPQCGTLVHSDQMEQFAAQARALEAHGEPHVARERWLACLPLLPEQSLQAQWIRTHVRELEGGGPRKDNPHPSSSSLPRWAQKLGPLGPIALALIKFKSVLSFAAFFGFYWQAWGAKFGLGIAVLILVHEMGHFIDIRRRGLPADMPMFVPGFGAYVKWNAMGVRQEVRSAISLAGPFAGLLGAAVCALLWFQTGYGLWSALARTSAWFNVLNLIPLWILDGNSAIRALSKLERALLLVVNVAMGFALHEVVFGLVAVGMLVRLFTRDNPEESNNFMTAYFIAVITGLAVVLWLVPGKGTGL